MIRGMMCVLLSAFVIGIWGCPMGNGNGNVNDNAAGNQNDNTGGNSNANDNSTATAETLTANLDGDQETPPVVTTASGSGTATLNAERTQLTFQFTAAGLSGRVTAAHFHNEAAGTAGPIVFPFPADIVVQDGGNVTISGTWTFADTASTISVDDAVNALLENNIYVNLHTAMSPLGEIRGQLIYADSGE